MNPMALPQHDNYIEEIYKTEACFQFSLMYNDEPEIERLRWSSPIAANRS